MRAVLGHAVDVLRRDADREKARREIARDGGAGHVEHLHPAERGLPAPAHLRERVDRVRGHAHDIGRAGLVDPVDHVHALRQIVQYHLEAGRERLRQANIGDVVRGRRKAQEHRAGIVAPVAHHRAPVGEQRIVRVHHPFGRAGGAGSEREVSNLVRIQIGREARRLRQPRRRERMALRIGRLLAARLQAVDTAHARKRGRLGEDVAPRGVGAVAGLRHQRRALDAREQLQHFAGGVVLVQRRIAHIAVARAGKQDDDRLRPARQPHRDALAALDAGAVQILGHAVHPCEQTRPS